MEVLIVLATYAWLTLLGLVTSRVIIYLIMGRLAMPEKPEREQMVDCAHESLRMATELRLNANALYDQLSGKVHHR